MLHINLKTKKMSIENLNLVELNAQEVKEIEGGFLPIIFAIAFYVGYKRAEAGQEII
jgi:hypothetical protein